MKRLFLFSLCFTVLIYQSNAQQVKKVSADKIIAQVGDKIILHSDIVNAIADYKRQGGAEANLPLEPECAFLEGQLIQKALELQAEKDSLIISDDEIDAKLDNKIRYYIGEYGSKEIVEEVAGKTIYQIKEDFRQVIKEQFLADRMRTKIVENVKITPTEVQAYHDRIPKDSLPYYESEIEVSQIIAQPKANKDVEEYVMKQLYDYKRQVEGGTKKFEQLAKMYSEDPGSKDNGGMYNINRNDKQWDPAFFSAIWKLKEGQISPVVKSKFGYHLIQMVSRNGEDVVIRHILKIPPVTEDEVAIAVQKLDSIRVKLIAHSLSFGEAINRFSDDENSKFNGGALQGRDGSTYISIDQLPDKDLVAAIKDLKPGEFSKPQIFTDEKGRKTVRLVYLKTRTSPHRQNMKDDYNKIASAALDAKKQAKLEVWFKDHLPNYYITIDKEFSGCKTLNDWWKYAAKQ